jgi:hypothetical protein
MAYQCECDEMLEAGTQMCFLLKGLYLLEVRMIDVCIYSEQSFEHCLGHILHAIVQDS